MNKLTKTLPKMKNNIFVSLVLLISGVLNANAFDYTKAEEAYRQKNYEEAAELFSQAIEKEGMSAGLLYNLGNSYYRLGKDGEAVLCYERAKKLDPGNETINQNLNFLASKIIDSNKGELKGKKGNVEPDQESFLDSVYRLIAIDMQSNNWAVFAVMAFILFLGGLALYMFTPNVLARKTGFFSGLIFLGFTVIFLIFSFVGAKEYTRQDKAILMNFTTSLLQNPESGASTTSTLLHKGTKVTILETKKGKDGSDWYKVRLNGDNIGWVNGKEIEII